MQHDEYLLPRRGTKGAAISDNIILQRGELYFEVPDTGIATGFGKIKMGDGSTAYSDLPYFLKQSIVDENEYFNDEMSIPFTDTSTVTNNNSELLLGVSSGNTTSNLFTNIKQLLYNFNSKIAYINTKLEALNNSKQDKLTEGNGIYISKDNVIKADNLIGTEIIVNCISSMNGRYVYCYKNGVEIGKALVSGGRATIFVDQVGTLTLKIDGIYRTVEAPYYSKYEVSFTSIGFGFRRNLNDENPATRITYLEENASFTPAHMNFTTGKFEWGSWENAWFLPRPCMVKYDGTVDYYLDPDDYTKKEDGTPSDVANVNYGGNAMMEWPKIWYYYYTSGNDQYFLVANYQVNSNYVCYSNYDCNGNQIDHFYTGIYNPAIINSKYRSISGVNRAYRQSIYNATTYCTNNNVNGTTEWYSEYWCDRTLITNLLILMGHSNNIKNVFGYGINNISGTGVQSGVLNKKGMFYGYSGYGNSVKVFGMENWYADIISASASAGCYQSSWRYKLTWSTVDGSGCVGFRMGTGINSYITTRVSTGSRQGTYTPYFQWGKFGFLPCWAGYPAGNDDTYECAMAAHRTTHNGYYCIGIGEYGATSIRAISNGDAIFNMNSSTLSLKPLKR